AGGVGPQDRAAQGVGVQEGHGLLAVAPAVEDVGDGAAAQAHVQVHAAQPVVGGQVQAAVAAVHRHRAGAVGALHQHPAPERVVAVALLARHRGQTVAVGPHVALAAVGGDVAAAVVGVGPGAGAGAGDFGEAVVGAVDVGQRLGAGGRDQ